MIEKLKAREAAFKDSLAKLRGILEVDKDQVRTDERIISELVGRIMEIQQTMKDLEEKK